MDDHEPRADGANLRARAQGPKSERIHAVAAELDPDLPELIDSFVFGNIWSRPGLSFEERMLVAIGALAASGHPDQLRNYLFGALDDGIEPIKVREAIMMSAVYGGFPRMIDALTVWHEAIRSLRRHGEDVDLGYA